jgi:hypothetical protein
VKSKRKASEAISSTDEEPKMSLVKQFLKSPPSPIKEITKKQRKKGRKKYNDSVSESDSESVVMEVEQEVNNLSQEEIINIVGTQQSIQTPQVKPTNYQKPANQQKPESSKQLEWKLTNERYTRSDKAPYVVLIEAKEVTDETPGINVMKVGHILQQLKLNKSSLTSLRKTGKHRVKMVTDNIATANLVLLQGPRIFQSFNYSIPMEDKQSFGIVKNVPLDFDTNEIKSQMDPKLRVVDITRLTTQRKGQDGTNRILPTTTIKIQFNLNYLPESIDMFLIQVKVAPFVWRPRPCSNCQRYGHSYKSCKASKRCPKCGGPHKEEECNEATHCIYCNLPHKVGHSECMEHIKQTEIKNIMTTDKKSYKEATIELHNRYNTLSGTNTEDFPNIHTTQGHKPTFHLGNQWREKVFADSLKKKRALAAYLTNAKNLIVGESISTEPSSPLQENPYKVSEAEQIKSALSKIVNNIQNNNTTTNNDNLLINVASDLQYILRSSSMSWSAIANQHLSQPQNNTPNNTTNNTEQYTNQSKI